MRTCPQCHQDNLLEIIDDSSGFVEHVCSFCGYYDSNSPAYAMHPEVFRGLGIEVLGRLQRQVCMHGMTDCEAKAWLAQEPTFGKAILKPYAKPQEAKVRSPRDKLTPYRTCLRPELQSQSTLPILRIELRSFFR
jgi:hypothetical protein